MLRAAVPLLLALASLPAVAIGGPVDDLRLTVEVMNAPRVKEKVVAPNENRVVYDWIGIRSIQTRFDIDYVSGRRKGDIGDSGWIWSLGLGYADWNLTPDWYRTNAGETANSRQDIDLHGIQIGVNAGIGWASRPRNIEIGDWHWELRPVLRGGVLRAETLGHDLIGNPALSGSWGVFWEAGLRGGVVLADAGWLLGVSLGWDYGRAEVSTDLPNGDTSHLSIIRNGPAVELSAGWRF